jgi:alkylhydroperoxidase family enzyme
MTAFIDQPKRIPFYLRIGIWIAERMTGKEMLPARLLAWQPKAAVGSGILELLAAHGRSVEEKRLLRLVRLQAAFVVGCSFCLDMNAFELEQHGVAREEFTALQTNFQTGYPSSISNRERIALEYAKLISATPLEFPSEIVRQVKAEFSDREIVLIATTVSQVNYWARLVQSLGIPPAGFSESCLSQTNMTA